MWQNKKNKSHPLRGRSGRAYASRDYSNPYFSGKKKRRKLNLPALSLPRRFKLAAIAGILLLLSSLGLLFFSNFLIINDIRIQGADRIDQKYIRQIAEDQLNYSTWLVFKQKNLFFFDQNELAESLNSKYAFENLKISKKWPRTLVISYEEKSYALIWQEDNIHYYVDNSGSVLEEANILDVGERDYPIIDNETGIKTMGTKIAASPAYISQVLEFFFLSKDHDFFQVERFVKDMDEESLKVKVQGGPMLYLSLSDSIGGQLDRIILIKNEKLGNDFFNRQYIDARSGQTIYYQ